jgi:threonine dehydrogenase-like Zn-dependent dehydrogenase
VISVNVAVIGMGLIGGSLLRALALAGHWVIGYDLDPSTRAMARNGAAQAPVRRGGRWRRRSWTLWPRPTWWWSRPLMAVAPC